MKTFRVIIAGGRDFNDYSLLKSKCDNILSEVSETAQIVIISGTAQGADKLGEKYAEEKGYEIERHPALWDKHGKAAGPIRNLEMAENADALIAFWDGKSRGTQNMISIAKNKKMMNRVILYHHQ